MRGPDQFVLVHLYQLLFLPASCPPSSARPRKQRLTGGSLLLDQTPLWWVPFTLSKSNSLQLLRNFWIFDRSFRFSAELFHLRWNFRFFRGTLRFSVELFNLL